MKGCETNADCNTGEYCFSTGYDCGYGCETEKKPYLRECRSLSGDTKRASIDGIEFIGSTVNMNGWSAVRFCEAHGKPMANFNDMKCAYSFNGEYGYCHKDTSTPVTQYNANNISSRVTELYKQLGQSSCGYWMSLSSNSSNRYAIIDLEKGRYEDLGRCSMGDLETLCRGEDMRCSKGEHWDDWCGGKCCPDGTFFMPWCGNRCAPCPEELARCGNSCVCPEGQFRCGGECVCPTGSYWSSCGYRCCPNETAWDGTLEKCQVCPSGTVLDMRSQHCKAVKECRYNSNNLFGVTARYNNQAPGGTTVQCMSVFSWDGSTVFSYGPFLGSNQSISECGTSMKNYFANGVTVGSYQYTIGTVKTSISANPTQFEICREPK